MDNQTIGKRLKKTRQNRNMTLDELAEVRVLVSRCSVRLKEGNHLRQLRHFGKLQLV